jgi:hypothetical protein
MRPELNNFSSSLVASKQQNTVKEKELIALSFQMRWNERQRRRCCLRVGKTDATVRQNDRIPEASPILIHLPLVIYVVPHLHVCVSPVIQDETTFGKLADCRHEVIVVTGKMREIEKLCLIPRGLTFILENS